MLDSCTKGHLQRVSASQAKMRRVERSSMGWKPRRACSEQTVTLPLGSFSGAVSDKRCTKAFGAVTVPDVLFVGAGLTYRIDFTR
jgi:hypothetical protein